MGQSEEILTHAQIVDRINRMPADVQIANIRESDPELRFIAWVNSHCFLWTRPNINTKWDCEEL